MDLVLDIADSYVLDSVYAHLLPLSTFARPLANATHALLNSSLPAPPPPVWAPLLAYLPHPATLPPHAASVWPRDYAPRQLLSLTVLTLIGIAFLYFSVAAASYRWVFNHDMMRHPRFLPNQVRQEIRCSLRAFPAMTLLTLPWFEAEVRGYSRLYSNVGDYGWPYLFLSIGMFLVFTDFCIYWVHRWEHHPLVYKHLHKPHHKWIIPSPFASHAFHPVDGYLQSIPYHLFIFIFPLQRHLYLGLFGFVNFWSIFIHDSDMITGHPLEKIINGPAHHTLHHLYFTVNYGQYFTFADRLGGSYRQPAAALDPMHAVRAANKGVVGAGKGESEREWVASAGEAAREKAWMAEGDDDAAAGVDAGAQGRGKKGKGKGAKEL